MEKSFTSTRAYDYELLKSTLNNLCINYMKLYDEYNSGDYERDVVFLKELLGTIGQIAGVLEVYTRDKEIHPKYAIEKLEISKTYIDGAIRYYNHKLEMEDKEK